MKRTVLFCMTLAGILAAGVRAAQPETIGQLDEAIKAAAGFQPGGDSGPLRRMETIAMASLADAAVREAVEQRLIGMITSDATADAKMLACRMLQTVGTEKCIPALEALLADAKLSHGACFALGRMEYAAAGDALLGALGKTRGELRAGIINTLADRGERKAMGAFIRLLKSDDAVVACAAARGLGRLGGDDAVAALKAARPQAAGAIESEIDDALLVCAERYLAEGKRRQARAAYDLVRESRPVARLRGVVAAGGSEAGAFLAGVIRDSEGPLKKSAIGLIPLVKGAAATEAFVAVLPSLSAEGQELMIRALGERGDATATAAIAAATKSEHEQVRVAAVDSLGSVGDASAAPVLAAAAAKAGGSEKLIARASLVRLSDEGVNAALIKATADADAGVRAECVRALADRRAVEAKGRLFEAARDEDAAVRREAIRALGMLAEHGDLPAMMTLMVAPKEAGDRAAIEQAIIAVFGRMDDRGMQAGEVLKALRTAAAEARPALLRLLRMPATAEALAAVRAAMDDAAENVRDAAVRTLADWPDAAPAEDLLKTVSGGVSRVHKVLALRGYVRMAGMSQNPTAMYVRAMELAQTPDDRKLVLAGLGNADSAEALTLVEKYLDDEALKAEAAQAAVQIAGRLRTTDATAAKAALKRIIAAAGDAGLRQKAQDIINEMEQYEGYILAWLTDGPYMIKGKDSRAVFDTPFGPEKPGEAVKWQRLDKGVGAWDINLEAMYGGKDHCAAYVKTRVWSPMAQKARLEMGSDDAIKVWLNGELVHEMYQHRGLTARQDQVNVDLKQGYNDLMLKVVDHEGGWQFCCRIRKPDGSAIENLTIHAE
ncbi:MAG: HEAT repeat domain-containing protein [Phycisphaerae bacterium]|nr:HEAT repeat domain-containing protein [Phycisphaerae bacterium]